MKIVSFSLVVNIFLAETYAVACVLMVGPVSLGGKFECCVRFNLGFYPFRNRHDFSHSIFASLVLFTDLF